ncbi:MAG: hypothetical protein GC155_05425 [Alphaproteobacteria bacterium]|nr:hypothetical protein [Alphaproteobacteria bacterium]
MYGLDGPKGPEIRKTTRPAHLEWIASLGVRKKLAGPLLAEDGAASIGSMLIIEAETLGEARDVYAADPYARAGLWDRVEIRQFTWLPN